MLGLQSEDPRAFGADFVPVGDSFSKNRNLFYLNSIFPNRYLLQRLAKLSSILPFRKLNSPASRVFALANRSNLTDAPVLRAKQFSF